MKIGVLTFHDAINYGALFQAYALTKTINDIGFNCEIIDFKESPKIELPKELIKKYGIVKGTIKSINRYRLGVYKITTKERKFHSFSKKYLPVSKKEFFSLNSINEENYDAIVFGSDQIWNENLTEHAFSEYMGDFGSNDGAIRKVSYAASNGRGEFPEERKTEIKQKLGEFSAISTRENSLTEYINEELSMEAKTVADPVLLLSADKWQKIESGLPKDLEKGKYIFVYTFDEPATYETARYLSKKSGLPIVNVRWCGKHERFNDMIQLPDTGPGEFLSLIHNAAYVVTSSFHGVVFSTIFRKNLYACISGEYNERIVNVLGKLGLDKCELYNNHVVITEDRYESNCAELEKFRNESIEFLKGALGNAH